MRPALSFAAFAELTADLLDPTEHQVAVQRVVGAELSSPRPRREGH